MNIGIEKGFCCWGIAVLVPLMLLQACASESLVSHQGYGSSLSSDTTQPQHANDFSRSSLLFVDDNTSSLSDEELLAYGWQTLQNNNIRRAIDQFFEPVIARCAERQKQSNHRLYVFRSKREKAHYEKKAVANGTSIQLERNSCSEALFFKGYAGLDLGRIREAKKLVKQALELSPANAVYLAELGHILQIQRRWDAALKVFTRSEKMAVKYSPSKLRLDELARAKRGSGYSLIELGRLDEAHEKFIECLEIDNSDIAALNELKYIKSLRAQLASN